MELFDTHCHLTFDGLIENIDSVIERSRAGGINEWITIGTDINDCRKAIELTEKYENLYAAVAIHPHDAKNVTDDTLTELKMLAQRKKVVAIGETGLDYHYEHSPHDVQKQVFIKQLALAAEFNLPVIIHSRNAFDECLKILEQFRSAITKIVFHCFSGSSEQAKIVLDKGFYVSFTGVVTFKNAEKTRRAAQAIPLDRLMLETDCPYMSPEPVRKQKINEPALLIHTARFLAELKQMPLEDFAKSVTSTSKSFFRCPDM